MAAFLSGAAVDCGPSSVLKNVGGRIDRDVGLQQDRLVSNGSAAGPSRRVSQPVPINSGAMLACCGDEGSSLSRQVFNPASSGVNGAHGKLGEASAGRAGPSRAAVPQPFDMAALRQHLLPAPSTQQQQPSPANQNWASGFQPSPESIAGPSRYRPVPAASSPGPITGARSEWAASYDPRGQQAGTSERVQSQNVAPWQRPVEPIRQNYLGYGHAQALYAPPASYASSLAYQPQYQQTHLPQPQLQHTANHAIHDWPTAEEFDRHLAESRPAEPLAQVETVERTQEMEEPLPEVNWRDDIPADLESVLRVPPTVPELFPLRPGANQATVEPSERYAYGDQSAILMSENAGPYARRKSVHFRESSGIPSSLEEALAQSTSVPGATASWEDPLVTDLSDFDEDAFMAFNGPQQVAKDGRIGMGDLENWGEMQKDWDEFQRGLPGGSTATRGADGRYLFQSRNPYASEAAMQAEERSAGRESPTVKGVLELEAAVQADPTDHHAWYALGLKQQENERESAAILALAKVVQLDPDYRPAYLALAVSYTNEGEHVSANRAIAKWIDLAPSADQIPGSGLGVSGSWQEDQRILVDRLIGLARMSPEEVDPEVQVALGALFNSSEQYEKAEDCFHAALAARPDDWLLYNRLGATLANSGRSSEALEYYHKALSLHPNFIRALFNMGISLINMSQYSQAAQRILEALRLQQADATEGYSAGTLGNAAKGVTSETLWQTLRSACLHMGRNDLVALATRKDLGAFPADISIVRAP